MKLTKPRIQLYLSIAISVFVVLEIFSFCTSKSITCQAYTDAKTLSWFPYQKGQLLIFTSLGSTNDTLVVGSLYKSEQSQTTSGGCGKPIGCSKNYNFTLNRNTGVQFAYFDFYSTQYDSVIATSQYANNQLRVAGTLLNSLSMTDTGLVKQVSDGIYTSQFFSSLILDGKIFTNVQQLNLNTQPSVSNEFETVYLSKSIGIIGYKKRFTSSLFVKQ